MAAHSEGAKELVRLFFEAMNLRRLDDLDSILMTNVVRHCQATPGIEVQSLSQFKEFMRGDDTAFPDSVQKIVHTIAEDDLVAVWATYEGTQIGLLGSLPPSGAKVAFDFSGVFRIVEGRIAEWWVTWDNSTVMRQLGHSR